MYRCLFKSSVPKDIVYYKKRAWNCVLFIALKVLRKPDYTNGIDSRPTPETSVGTDCAILV